MRVTFNASERDTLRSRLGLPAEATDDQIQDAVIGRLMTAAGRGKAPTPRRAAVKPEDMRRSSDGEALIAAAIADNKFPQSRAEHYRNRFERDPGGTVELIGKLASVPANLLEPLEDEPNAYPTEWVRGVSPIEQARQARAEQYRSRVHQLED
jgi:hypothetical protein